MLSHQPSPANVHTISLETSLHRYILRSSLFKHCPGGSDNEYRRTISREPKNKNMKLKVFFYRKVIVAAIFVQPNLQYVIHPTTVYSLFPLVCWYPYYPEAGGTVIVMTVSTENWERRRTLSWNIDSWTNHQSPLPYPSGIV
jgi:hypothetical protein